jgi:hypothetical protein
MKARRVRDYVIYVSIGLAIVGFGIWHADRGGGDLPESAWKWIGLAVTTPILFGYAVVEYRRDWRQARFWGIILALLMIHLGLFSIVLSHVKSWSWLGFVVLIPIESTGIGAALLKAGYRAADSHHS